MNYISMLSVWDSFYWEESFEGTYLVCTWNLSVPLQKMHIQGEQSSIFSGYLKARGPNVCCVMTCLLQKQPWQSRLNLTWHGQLTKFKEPPSHMCIDCGKSNTNKEEVDKHIMCHTRGKNTIRLWTLWKGIYTVAYTNSYLWKAQLSESML